MKNLDFGYSQSKWVAEQLVYAAGKQGLRIRVYRPSLISASSDGIGGRDDISVRLLSFMIQHGVAVNARNQISFLPVDVAAHNIAAIFSQRETRAETFHVTVDDYYNMADVTRTITRDFGYPFTYYDIPEFVEQMNRRCTREDLLYPLVDFFNAAQHKVAAMQHKRYCNEEYRRARAATGTARPDPSLDQTVMRGQQRGVAVDHIVGGALLGLGHVLRHLAHAPLAGDEVFAAVFRQRAVEQRKQRGLARAVAAHQADFFARIEGDGGAVEQHFGAAAQGNVF